MTEHQCNNDLPETDLYGNKINWTYKTTITIRKDGTGTVKCPKCGAEEWFVKCYLRTDKALVILDPVECGKCHATYDGEADSIHAFFKEYYLDPRTARFLRPAPKVIV